MTKNIIVFLCDAKNKTNQKPSAKMRNKKHKNNMANNKH